MQTLKIVILILGVLFGIYHIYYGFNKSRTEGLKFNLKEVLRHKPIANAMSGNLIFDGALCFLVVLMLYFVWF